MKKILLSLAAITLVLSAATAFATTLYDSTITGDSPVSYWPMQETNGPTIYDVVGTNNGTLEVSPGVVGAPAYVNTTSFVVTNGGLGVIPGFIFGVPTDTALYFTNSNYESVFVPYSAGLDSATFTAEAWCYYQFPLAITPPTVDEVPVCFVNNGGSQYGWLFYILDSGSSAGDMAVWCAKSSFSGWNQLDANKKFSNWNHFVMTYDGTTFTYYTNGVKFGSIVGGYGNLHTQTATPLVFGSIANSGLTLRGRFYNGGLSHVAVYNHALTGGQVLNHYIVATLGATAPIIGTQPNGFTNFVGYTNSLTVAAAGSPLFYQWYDGASKVTGATNDTLVLTNLQLTNAGSYTVIVTNAAGSVTSTIASVAVLALPTNVYDSAVIGGFPNAYYPLNETSGTVANDVIQAGNNDNQATYIDAPTLGNPGASSYLGTSVGLDGATQGIDLNDPNALNIAGNTTMETWVSVQSSNLLGQAQYILAHGPYYISANPSLAANIMGITVDNSGNGYYFIESFLASLHQTNIAYYPVPAADIGSWVHLVATADGTAWNLFRNGALVATTPDAAGAVAANGGWAFGAANSIVAGQPSVQAPLFQGGIQHVALYSYALSPVTIQQHYQLGLTGTYTPLPRPTVSIQQSGGNVTVNWSGGSLMSAPSVTGPWTYLTDTNASVISSPYTVAAGGTAQYFRASLLAP